MASPAVTLPDGLYDLLLTEHQRANLDVGRADLTAFGGEQLELLLDALSRQVSGALADAHGDESDAAMRQVDIVNALPAEVTVLLIEHDMDLVFNFARTVSVLVNGSLFAEGDVKSIANDPRVKSVYLGEGTPHG